MSSSSRLYGLYIHNLTNTLDDRSIALETISKLMGELPPMRYEYGDVLVLLPDDDRSDIISEICEKNGFMVEMIHPNQLYRLVDSLVVHYVFVSTMVEQSVIERFIYDWEISMGLTQADMRYTRYIKTFFMKKK